MTRRTRHHILSALHDWRQSLVTIGVLLIWGAVYAIFGGLK